MASPVPALAAVTLPKTNSLTFKKRPSEKRRGVFQPLIFRDYLRLGRVLFYSSCWFHLSMNQYYDYYAFTSLPTCTSWLLRYLDNKITVKDTKTSTSRAIHLQKLRSERYSASLKAASAFSFCSSAKSWRKKGALKHFVMRKISFRTIPQVPQEVNIGSIYVYTFKTKKRCNHLGIPITSKRLLYSNLWKRTLTSEYLSGWYIWCPICTVWWGLSPDKQLVRTLSLGSLQHRLLPWIRKMCLTLSKCVFLDLRPMESEMNDMPLKLT